MGRRKKAAKKVVKKKAARVPTQFKCIFCSTGRKKDDAYIALIFISV
jgi:transcription elongation factor Elf1